MKKAILMMIAAAMLCGTMTACVSTKTEDSVPDKPEATDAATEAKDTEAETEAETEADTEAETEADTEADVPAETEADTDAQGDAPADSEAAGDDSSAEGDAPAVTGDTLGQTLLADFETRAADGTLSCQILADELMKNPAILFGPATMPVEPGLLTGFGNAEITGFKEGTMFAPMIGSIAFVGYVFELEEGTDGEAFMQTLKDNADPRWNICVEAEETVVGQSANKVFFVMCPTSLEG